MNRLYNWRSRLIEVLTNAQRQKFEWGSLDCALGLAVPAIKAQTDIDLGAEWRGTYSTAFGAMKALRSKGFESVADVAAHHFREIHPSHAQFGDIVAVESDDTGWALGVVAGSGEVIAVLTPTGLGHLPRSYAKRAFAIS